MLLLQEAIPTGREFEGRDAEREQRVVRGRRTFEDRAAETGKGVAAVEMCFHDFATARGRVWRAANSPEIKAFADVTTRLATRWEYEYRLDPA